MSKSKQKSFVYWSNFQWRFCPNLKKNWNPLDCKLQNYSVYQFQSHSHYTVGEICSTKLKLDLSWTKMIYSTYPESNQKKVLWSTGNYIFLLIKRMPTKIKVKAYAFNSLIRLFAILLCIPRYLSYVRQFQWLIAWIGTTKYLCISYYVCICIYFIVTTEVPCRV